MDTGSQLLEIGDFDTYTIPLFTSLFLRPLVTSDKPRPDRRPVHQHARSVSRRQFVAGTVGVASAALAGCLGGGGSSANVPKPVTLTDQDSCDVCGMVIPAHPGPTAEIFYADHSPSGHDNPAHFDSVWEAFQYYFDHKDRGWKMQVFYATDYSSVGYSLVTDGGDTLIPVFPKASAQKDITDLTLVVDSAVKGAMGRDLIGFSSSADAKQFKADHGGKLMQFGDVTRQTIAVLNNA